MYNKGIILKFFLFFCICFFNINILAKDLNCEYLKTKDTPLTQNDLPCLIQELPILMKKNLELPKVIDEKTKLVNIRETLEGKEITYYYNITENIFSPFNPEKEIRGKAYLSAIEANCSNPKFIELFNLGADFKFIYFKNNKDVIFNFLINKKICNDFQE